MGETSGEQASPHAVVLVRGSDYARSLTFTRRGLQILAERKPGHDFQGGEAEARRILHDDQRSAAGGSRRWRRRPGGGDGPGGGEVHVGRNADAVDEPFAVREIGPGRVLGLSDRSRRPTSDLEAMMMLQSR